MTDALPRLHGDAFGELVLTLPDGTVVRGVVPVRCFPFSDPSGRVSLCDPAGREVVSFPRLDGVAPELREVLERELAAREFVPVIVRILDIPDGPEPVVWRVLTDRGETGLTLADEDDVRRLGEHDVLIVDAYGVRFRVPDVRRLDGRSRRLLRRYL